MTFSKYGIYFQVISNFYLKMVINPFFLDSLYRGPVWWNVVPGFPIYHRFVSSPVSEQRSFLSILWCCQSIFSSASISLELNKYKSVWSLMLEVHKGSVSFCFLSFCIKSFLIWPLESVWYLCWVFLICSHKKSPLLLLKLFFLLFTANELAISHFGTTNCHHLFKCCKIA